jgi:hypothetical protein
MRVYHFLSAQYALKTLYEHRIKISTFPDLNDPFELWPFKIDSVEDQEGFERATSQFSKRFGVVCFSRNWDDPVLWSHYSDKHKGICLGFDVSDYNLHFIEVNYVSERLPRQQHEEEIETMARQWFSTKFKSWQYEKEVRVFTNLGESEGGLYFYDFDEHGEHIQLREVILGHRCSVEKRAIDRVLRNYPAPVTSIKACLSLQAFKVIEDREG